MDNHIGELGIMTSAGRCSNTPGMAPVPVVEVVMQDQSTPTKSQTRNVFWDKAAQKWRVEFRVGGKKIFAGRFDDVEQARRVADDLRRQYFPYREQKKMQDAERKARRAERQRARPSSGGLPWYLRPENKEKKLAAQQRLYQRRREWYAEFMQGRVCVACGHDGSGGNGLEWHHRNPKEKSFPIARGVFLNPPERVLAEIAKCDLLCRTCHRATHARRRLAPPLAG